MFECSQLENKWYKQTQGSFRKLVEMKLKDEFVLMQRFLNQALFYALENSKKHFCTQLCLI